MLIERLRELQDDWEKYKCKSDYEQGFRFGAIMQIKEIIKIAEEEMQKLEDDLKKALETDLTGCFSSQKQCDEWNEDTNKIIEQIFHPQNQDDSQQNKTSEGDINQGANPCASEDKTADTSNLQADKEVQDVE